MSDDGPPEEHPAKVERVYVRRDRSFTALEEVRCPVCGRTKEWRMDAHLPWCSGHSISRRNDPSRRRW